MLVTAALPPPTGIARDAQTAIEEDLGHGDLTAALIPADKTAVANIVVREPAIVCGTAWADACLAILDPDARIDWRAADGEAVQAGTVIARVEAKARVLLSAERSMLNFLQTLSATATTTRRYVEQIKHTKARILDTRKTLPGLRQAQKYACRCGGAINHRHGLFDGILIKENHIVSCGSIEAAVAQAKSTISQALIVVEVESLEELEQAQTAGADRALLDNFSLEAMRLAVKQVAGCMTLEASGGIEGDGLLAIAETGVDYISIGALSKHVRAIDLSMRVSEVR
jgi:nicotinate-nucleotide pyrophosphorylase (carboxylating)